MGIWIQASEPRYSTRFDFKDENISEAIETVFPMMTESFYIIWNGIHIPLSYKYDASIMIQDIIVMLEKLIKTEEGDFQIMWASNTFCCKWHLNYSQNELLIEAKWESVVGNIESVLTDSGCVVVSKRQFIAEWKNVIIKISKALKKANYTKSIKDDINRLDKIINDSDGIGVLYEST